MTRTSTETRVSTRSIELVGESNFAETSWGRQVLQPRTLHAASPRPVCAHAGCGKQVPRNRGRDLLSIDPEQLFCTLRCAARAGVAATLAARRFA